MAQTTCDLHGVESVMSKVEDKLESMEDSVLQKLFECGQEVIAESTKVTPLMTGELRARTFVERPVKEGEEWVCHFGYEKNGMMYPKTSKSGVTDSGQVVNPSKNEYAVYVHENLNAHHKIGKAKFLEDTFKQIEPKLLKYLATSAEEGLRK